MTCNRWNSGILFVAILLASIRPVLAANGWIDMFVNPRAASSESSEDESERETDTNATYESKKARRTTVEIRSTVATRERKVYLRENRAHQSATRKMVSGAEHALRHGLGTPLRI